MTKMSQQKKRLQVATFIGNALHKTCVTLLYVFLVHVIYNVSSLCPQSHIFVYNLKFI